MGLENLSGFAFSYEFLLAFLSIILIDLILAGDNAVVIAMAVRSLPAKNRRKGIIVGSAAAVILRIGLTFFAAQLLQIGLIKFFGGLLITWIAVKLFVEGAPDDKVQRTVKTVGQAIMTIMIADLVMSADNVLAVAGASEGNPFLLVFGLGFSIPFVVFTSGFLSRAMSRYPFVIYIGAAMLGRVAGDMIITDPYIAALFGHPGPVVEYVVQAVFAVGVVAAGWIWMKKKALRKPAVITNYEKANPFYVPDWDLT